MDSSEPSIIKSLIDYSEYQRLLYIEEQYNKLKNQTKVQIGTGSEQLGFGSEISPYSFSASSLRHSEGDDPIEPKVLALEPKLEEPVPASNLKFDVKINKNQENDVFDDQILLKIIPKNKKHLALQLLSEINNRGPELTFNSSGTIFINQVAIPNSNIFILFPFLYKKQKCNLIGFDDLIEKIHEMGLDDLILNKVNKKKVLEKAKNPVSDDKTPGDELTNVHWWYIGD